MQQAQYFDYDKIKDPAFLERIGYRRTLIINIIRMYVIWYKRRNILRKVWMAYGNFGMHPISRKHPKALKQ